MSRKRNIQDKILGELHGKKALNKESLYDNLDINEKSEEYAVNRSLKTLKESGLIEEIETDRSSFLRITPSGRNKLRNIKLNTPTSLISTSWDGFWRMVILDLPESRKSERDSVRYILKKAGFVCMKNSIWVSPYPLEHLFMNIKMDLGLTDEIMIVVTKDIDPMTEKNLFKTFGFK